MAAVSQTTLSNAFSWMKMLEFQLRFHWNLILRVQLTIIQHWFRLWLGAGQATSHYLNQWWLVYWRIYASLDLKKLIRGQCVHSGRYDDVIICKHFPRYRPFVRGIHRSPVNFPRKGQWRGAFMFSFNYACTNGWVNDHDTGDLRRHRIHYYVTIMPAARCRAIKFRTQITPCNGIYYLYLRKYDVTEMYLGSWPIVTKQTVSAVAWKVLLSAANARWPSP